MAKSKEDLSQFQLGAMNVIFLMETYCNPGDVAFVRGRAIATMLQTTFRSFHNRQLKDLVEIGWLRRRVVGNIKAYEYALSDEARMTFRTLFEGACKQVTAESAKTLFE